jgi:leucyl aminopeptidase
MQLKINFVAQNFNIDSVLICDDKFKPEGIQNKFDTNKIKTIINTINANIKKNENIIIFNLKPDQKIIAVRLLKNNTFLENIRIGSKLFDLVKTNSIEKFNIISRNFFGIINNNKSISQLLHGMYSKSYEFQKYKTNTAKKKLEIFISKNSKKFILNLNYDSINQGINFTKDLVSEPGNILHPDEYVSRLKKLKSLGLKITIYNRKKLKKLGMNALLGVGQGSIKGSYLATIEWNGLGKKQKPLAFVGKGVCFDTGGISLKPAKFMEDMTYDMAGSAVVAGLMKTLALRKAKINVVGVLGLVENMPDGNAQRPGDIVKSYSGKTIEILNTDAEGRLVLADALTYTEKKFKPKFIVDLATLTGAIIVSLGSEYAGLFSNDDKISNQLSQAGEKVGEKVWRMPLNENYDKLIDSKKADIQNINYVGGAGSITAAQFLQRFILNKTPWAHLDIAGMAFSKYGGALNSGGATGYGVRLLNQLIEDYYE